jgi:hypothetical protein
MKLSSYHIQLGDLIMLADRLQALFKMTKEYMIQRTELWKSSIINNSMPSIRLILNSIYETYFNNNEIVDIFEGIIDGLNELERILNEKVDFI